MINNNQIAKIKKAGYSLAKLLCLIIGLTFITGEVYSQTYEMTLKPRRLGDQVGVEIWMKTLDPANAVAIGDMNIGVKHNAQFLEWAGTESAVGTNGDILNPLDLDMNPQDFTSIINFDINDENAYEVVQSPFALAVNGYNPLTAGGVSNGTDEAGVLNVNVNGAGNLLGFVPASTGDGSFVGMMKFDIEDHTGLTGENAEFMFNDDDALNDMQVLDMDGNSLEADVTFVNPTEDFSIIGITVLNPNQLNQPVNRYPNPAYASMPSTNRGYPIYFERSGLTDTPAEYGTGDIAYVFEYALDANTPSWTEIGRVAETTDRADAFPSNGEELADYVSGDIANLYETTDPTIIFQDEDYFITRGYGTYREDYSPTELEGEALPIPEPADMGGASAYYPGVLRVIWADDINFPFRSENALLRIRQIENVDPTLGDGLTIDDRDAIGTSDREDVSDASFVLARLFFVQLGKDGRTDYLRTERNVSTSSQLTVMAWVNVNSYPAGADAEVGVVAASSGPTTTEEGAWMLYLDEGRFPAFRAREINGNGPNGYIAELVDQNTLFSTFTDASPIQNGHSENWRHLAATVQDNIVSLYVDGEVVATTENTNAVNIRMLPTLQPIWIGVNPNDPNGTGSINPDNYLNAGVKEVQVWRYAMTQEQIKARVAGQSDPNGATNAITGFADDIRSSLELYYTFQGVKADGADDLEYQRSANPLNYYLDGSISASPQNDQISYRPDRPHLRLTSPSLAGGEGVSNLEDKLLAVRWAAYGLGSIEPNTEDLEIQVARIFDGGGQGPWFDANDSQTPSLPLIVEIEDGEAFWEPYNNISVTGADDDLQGIIPVEEQYEKQAKLRIRGLESRNQEDVSGETGTFLVAPYFALSRDEVAQAANNYINIPGSLDLNMSGQSGLFEAWINPYRLPDTDDGETLFPIISKMDDAGNLHYRFGLRPDGRLEFSVGNIGVDGNLVPGDADYLRTALSDANNPIINPNDVVFDSTWYHVAVWFNLQSGTGAESEVRFFIDGVPQSSDEISEQLGSNIYIDDLNTYETFLGYDPSTDVGFVGALRDMRFWAGNPAGTSNAGSEPTELTRFIQGALTVRTDELGVFGGNDFTNNLVAGFTLNGGGFVNQGIQNSIPSFPESSGIIARIVGNEGISYTSTQPTIKLITPTVSEPIANNTESYRVRWVGFDYNRNGTFNNDGDPLPELRNGSDQTNQADLQFSQAGGGGNQDAIPYQYVANQAQNSAYENAMALPVNDEAYEFDGVQDRPQYALDLDFSISDPDLNDDKTLNDQGPMSAALDKGRLQFRARATINGYDLEYDNGDDGFVPTLITEGPYFTITPPSNFTIRVLLEGYHTGLDVATDAQVIQEDIGETFATQGLEITLRENNAGQVGAIVTRDTSRQGYADFEVTSSNRGVDGSAFADVPFIFSDVIDGQYFVVVDHTNYLPIMSRQAAPFSFIGDDTQTWAVESGWDFQNWDGNDDFVTAADAAVVPPTIGTKYTAAGVFNWDPNTTDWASTGLNWNAGRAGYATASSPSSPVGDELASMVGGDVVISGQIDAADRSQVRLDPAGSSLQSDVTGDGIVNATDRTIVDRNANKRSSLLDLTIPMIDSESGEVEYQNALPYVAAGDPLSVVHPLAEELSNRLNDAAREYVYNGEVTKTKTTMPTILAGGLSYEVTATPIIEGDIVKVPLYIKNTGGDFGLGNASFMITYDAVALRYTELVNESEVIFSSRPDLGYGQNYGAPTELTKKPLPSTRSIEIDYDAYTRRVGQNVPFQDTYLGTLVFNIVSPSDVYAFNWGQYTAVHSTDGRDITGDGNFRPIRPIVLEKETIVKIPNGGEQWISGEVYSISWTVPTSDKPVHIKFSSDNGASWTQITTEAVNLQAESFNWLTPRINSSECLVALVDAQTGVQIDRSDSPFSVSGAPAEISRPSVFDPVYAGGVKDFIRWNYGENVDVYFEFSANGLDGWQKVSSNVNSQMGQVQWTVPVANTKDAVVRMVNAQTNEVVAVSTPFKILAGSLSFTSPRAGDQLQHGQKQPVRWVFNNVGQFDLQVSFNGGSEWEDMAFGVQAASKLYDWLVPNVNSKQVVIRAIYNGDPELEYDRTDLFEIQGTVDVDNPEAYGYILTRAYPNPFRTETNIDFTIPVEEYVTISVYDSKGVEVMTIVEGQMFSAGSHTVTLNGEDLPAGMYLIRMNAGAFNLTEQVVNMK